MEKIQTILNKFKEPIGQRLRFKGWDFRIKYFEVVEICQKTKVVHGFLDSGEKMSYPLKSDHWVVYEPGAEKAPKAI